MDPNIKQYTTPSEPAVDFMTICGHLWLSSVAISTMHFKFFIVIPQMCPFLALSSHPMVDLKQRNLICSPGQFFVIEAPSSWWKCKATLTLPSVYNCCENLLWPLQNKHLKNSWSSRFQTHLKMLLRDNLTALKEACLELRKLLTTFIQRRS